MGEIKCPDCESMISAEVEKCPICGCPSTYFNKTAEELNNLIVSEYNFQIAAWGIGYKKGEEIFAKEYGKYACVADNIVEEMRKFYAKTQSINGVIGTVIPQGESALKSVIEMYLKDLYDKRINITYEQFCKRYSEKYDFNYSEKYEFVLERYADAMNMKSELAHMRQEIKNSRGRWQGGGFGVSGAIKGAVTASAMNLGSDFLHSFGDAARARADNQKVQEKLFSLYNAPSVKVAVCEKLGVCIKNAFLAYAHILEENGLMTTIDVDVKAAERIYENALKYGRDDMRKFSSDIVKCIQFDPSNRKYYDAILSYIVAFSEDDLGEFLKFWNVEYLYPTYEEQRIIGKKFDAQWEQEMKISKKWVRDASIESYVESRKWCIKFYKENNISQLPEFSCFADMLRRHYSKISEDKHSGFMSWYPTLEWIPEGIGHEEFWGYLRYERESLPASCLSDAWIVGDDREDIADFASKKSKIHGLLDFDGGPMMILDTSYFYELTKGLLVTKNYFVDLNKGTKIKIGEVVDIVEIEKRGELYQVCIKGKDSRILISSEEFDSENAIIYFVKLLRLYAVRYCHNITLWEKKMATKKPDKTAWQELMASLGNEGEIICNDIDCENKEETEVTEATLDLSQKERQEKSVHWHFNSDEKEIVLQEKVVRIGVKNNEEGELALFSDAIGFYSEFTNKEQVFPFNKIKEVRAFEDSLRIWFKGKLLLDVFEGLENTFQWKEELELRMAKHIMSTEQTPVSQECFCQFCGKKILRNSKFCNFCGQENKYRSREE